MQPSNIMVFRILFPLMLSVVSLFVRQLSVRRIVAAPANVLIAGRNIMQFSEMVNTLDRMKAGILFCIGGDGTQRGAIAISDEARRRGLRLSVIGIPKTIYNDIAYVLTTFGFESAVSKAKRATSVAYAEASGARNGIGLVKLMGRDSGFIAAFSAPIDNEVNFCNEE